MQAEEMCVYGMCSRQHVSRRALGGHAMLRGNLGQISSLMCDTNSPHRVSVFEVRFNSSREYPPPPPLRERETETERQSTDRETDRQSERETDRQTETERQRERQHSCERECG